MNVKYLSGMANLNDIFANNPLRQQLIEAQKQSKRLNMHITGKGMADAIETMDEFETEQKKNIRQKYSRSNRDMFARLHAPIAKVFSAKGGSTIINLPDNQLKQFTAFCANIRKGMSLRRWIATTGLDGYHIDPNGLVYLEIGNDGMPYPTYKSSADIFYYQLSGRKCELVIFTLSNKEAAEYSLQAQSSSDILDRMKSQPQQSKYYRVVDQVTDKIVMWDGKEVTEIPELTLPNLFLTCPAMVLSDMYEFNSDLFISPDSVIVELANSILTQNSVFEIWKNLHMFPKHWRMQSVCPTCQGTRAVGGNDRPDCKGTGFQKRSSVRDEIVIPMPESMDGKISIPTQFDGYSTPPIEAWDLATQDLDRLYEQAYFTKWGVLPKMKPQLKAAKDDKTATEVVHEDGAMQIALCAYSHWCESIETFIVELCAGLMYGSSYKGCEIKYGDRYAIEAPDSVWDKYNRARTSGAAQSVLDDLLTDYYESKYCSSPIQLQVALKQMRVEPWVHMTVAQVSALSITNEDKACKTYFSEWASTLTDMDWIMKNDDALRMALIAYVQPKIASIIEEVASLTETAAA